MQIKYNKCIITLKRVGLSVFYTEAGMSGVKYKASVNLY